MMKTRRPLLALMIILAGIHILHSQVSIIQSYGALIDDAAVVLPFTVPTGTNRLLVVNWQGNPDLATTFMPGDVTYNGVNLLQFGSRNIFYLPLGTGIETSANLVFNPGDISSGGLAVAVFAGVDQVTPITSAQVKNTITGTNTTTFSSMNSDAGDMMYDMIAGAGVSSLTSNATQTMLYSEGAPLTVSGGADFLISGSFKSVDPMVATGRTMSWTVVGTPTMGKFQAVNINYDGMSNPVPEIDIQGNNQSITDGDTAPSTLDGTNFGGVPFNSYDTHIFTIQNLASGPLVIPDLVMLVDGITVKSDIAGVFTLGMLSEPLPATLGWRETLTFEVIFTPSAGGKTPFTGAVCVQSNDLNEAVYNFNLSGIGGTPAGALQFDGSNDYVNVNNLFTGLADDFTITTRFRFPGTAGSFALLSVQNDREILEVKKTGNKYNLQTALATPPLTGSTDLSTNTWYQATVSYENGTLSLYLDGNLEASTMNTVNPLTGNLIMGANKTISQHFVGTMDEVRIWNRALCLPEIQAYIGCRLTAQEDELIHYYDFQNPNAFVGVNNAGQTTLQDKVGAKSGLLNSFGLTGTVSNWVENSTSGICSAPISCDGSSPIIATAGTHQSRVTGTVGSFTYFCDCDGNLLLGLDLGTSGAVVPSTGVKVMIDPVLATYHPFGTGFITNNDGGAIMNRRWEVSPTIAPSEDLGVRFFFTAADFAAVSSALEAVNPAWALTDVTDMDFFKVLSDLGEFPLIADIMPDDMVLLLHGGVSTTAWTDGTHGSDYYAEFQVSNLIGGGGGGAGGAQGALPVELSSFTARLLSDQTVELQWSTASELNNAGFEIEHRNERGQWTNIGFVPGQGTTTSPRHYQYTHHQPHPGFNYYRLKQIDYDGQFEYSDSRSVWLPTASLLVYPNPTNGQIRWLQAASGPTRVRVMDSRGQIVVQRSVTQAQLDITDLPAGLYVIELQNEQGTSRHRVIKE